MTKMSSYAPGTFSWIDLNTTDAGGAKDFYGKLFGWTFEDMPAGEAGTYTMFRLDGNDTAGMSEMGSDQQAQGMPPNWLSYVTVADINASAERVKSLGGTMMMEPFDVMDVGRMGIVQDPTGAFFAIWEARSHIGARVVNEPGSLSWNELATPDSDKARDFYTGLFGWTAQAQQMPHMVYTTFLNGERMNGGMVQMGEDMAGIPPHWMVYFAVEDCDASVKLAESLGGGVHIPPTDIPQTGRFSVIQDPQGAAFAVIKLENPE